MSTTRESTDPAVWIILALGLLLVVPMALMTAFWGAGMMGGTWMGGSWAGWGLGALVGLVVIVAVVYFLAKAIQATPSPPAYAPYPYAPLPSAASAIDPRAILDTRYAKGEITRDEYLRMRADLEGRAH